MSRKDRARTTGDLNTIVIEKPKLLIGEGKDESIFFQELLGTVGAVDVQVLEYGGKTQLSRFLRTLPTVPGFSDLKSLGITRDGDDSARSAFESVAGSLGKAGLPIPKRPGEYVPGSPRVGVFILPDCQRPGMLEDLCLDSIQAGPAMACVNGFFDCLRQHNHPEPNALSKARVHVWLASCSEPDRRLGEAAQRGYWPLEHPVFGMLKSFISQL